MMYSIIMVHNFIPHIHSEVTASNETHEIEHDHDSQQDHHHNHHHCDSNEEFGFIDLLLGALGDHHNTLELDHFDNDILIKANSNFELETPSVQDFMNNVVFYSSFKIGLQLDQKKNDFAPPRLLYEHSKNSTTTLRGPPQFS